MDTPQTDVKVTQEATIKKNISISVLPQKVLGLTPDVRGNGTFLDARYILYACGNSLVEYDLKNKSGHVKLNTLLYERQIQSFAVDQERTLLALGISGRNSLISLYSLAEDVGRNNLQKKYDVIFKPAIDKGIKNVFYVSFSAKGRFLATILAHPWRLCVYSLEQEIMILNLRFSHYHGHVIRQLNQVLFHPFNDNILLLIGEGVFRLIRLNIIKKFDDWEVRYKTVGFYQAKNLNVTCATWFGPTMLLAGTMDGRLLVLENGEIKGIYLVSNLNEVYLPRKPPQIKVRECVKWIKLAQEKLLNDGFKKIDQLASFEKGFVVAAGTLYIFEEPSDRPRWYILKSIVQLDDNIYQVQDIFHNIQTYSSEKFLTCGTQKKNIYFVDLKKMKEGSCADVLDNVWGCTDKVHCLSVCRWRPICLALSGNSLILWDHSTAQVINRWTFPVQPLQVSLHPSGMRFTLTLENELCIFEINHDYNYVHSFRSSVLKLEVFYEKSFSSCTFSEEGAYFGGSTNDRIYIFSSISYKIITVLETHHKFDRSIIDDVNDTIISIASDGLTACHDIQTGKIIWESQNKNPAAYSHFGVNSQQKVMYTIGAEGFFTMIKLSDPKKESLNIPIEGCQLRGISLSEAANCLFFATNKGSILVFDCLDKIGKNPEICMKEENCREYFLENHGITEMIITTTNKLITGNEDGCLSVYELEGFTNRNAENPYKTTDFLLGSFTILKFITSVRILNEKTLKGSLEIKEYMVNEKFLKWADENYTNLMSEISSIEVKLMDIEKLRAYYKNVWKEMDSFWEPQRQKELDIYSNYLYYNMQFRAKEVFKSDSWTRGLRHLKHIDKASQALSRVLDETLNDAFIKKTLYEKCINACGTLSDVKVKQMQQIRKKVEGTARAYREMYINARNTWNGLQFLIMQETKPDDATLFDKEILKKQYLSYIEPFQEDLTLLDKIHKKFMQDLSIKCKELIELSYFDDGPTGVSMKLLPNMIRTEYEIEELEEKKKADLCRYLRSQPEQWRELRRWDWVLEEYGREHNKWFMMGLPRFGNEFYNTHAYHELRDEEKLKHLTKKQMHQLQSCSKSYANVTRALKAVNQFNYECTKVEKNVKVKFGLIQENLEDLSMQDLFNKLMDVYNTLAKPNKIREDVYYLTRKCSKVKKTKQFSKPSEICPVTPNLLKNFKLKKDERMASGRPTGFCVCCQ